VEESGRGGGKGAGVNTVGRTGILLMLLFCWRGGEEG
jgi:hypothetical protein